MNRRIWRIWSVEHQGWWRQFRRGYTPFAAEAGLFDRSEAREIVLDANRYSDTLEEVAIAITSD